jgi:hypothetical protein
MSSTVIGNLAHDLIRLALSLASAAHGSDLPGVTTAADMVLNASMGLNQAAFAAEATGGVRLHHSTGHGPLLRRLSRFRTCWGRWRGNRPMARIGSMTFRGRRDVKPSTRRAGKLLNTQILGRRGITL